MSPHLLRNIALILRYFSISPAHKNVFFIMGGVSRVLVKKIMTASWSSDAGNGLRDAASSAVSLREEHRENILPTLAEQMLLGRVGLALVHCLVQGPHAESDVEATICRRHKSATNDDRQFKCVALGLGG